MDNNISSDVLSYGVLGGQPLSPRKQPPLEVPPTAGAPPSSPLSLAGDSAPPLGNNNDADFTHDNSDYQWFLDYNYRDTSCQHASVLSSLSSSYRGLGGCYEELARDMDANLAEADMESFRTRDIHALLSQLPASHLMHDTNRQGEMFASVSSSLMEKFCFDSSFSPHTSSQGEESSAGSINTMSLCKSELLFSPIREGGVSASHFSVDSLDCEGLDSDIILTCRANKHNYTIAFEGSTTMYEEDSDCQDAPHDKVDLEGVRYGLSSKDDVRSSLHRSFHLSHPTEASMANSDTTWSKLRSRSQLKRHPSGNNNTQTTSMESSGPLRSLSAPDLREENQDTTEAEANATECRFNPINYIKAYNNCSNNSLGSQASEGMSSSGDSRGPNNNQKPHNFNLVKLFMKQKSMSNDRIVGLENSSECWPNSSEGGDSGDSFSTDSKNLRPNNRLVTKMNLSSDKDYQSDDCEVPTKDTTKNPKRWVDSETEQYSTCTFEDSLVDGGANTDGQCKRVHDFIIEEDEVSEKSEPDHDKNIYATVNKVAQMRFNVNNNNSFGSNTGSPIRIRGNATTQTKKSSNSSVNSGSLSSCSESEGTQVTRMQRLLNKDLFDNKATSTQFSNDVIDKSMQTSCLSNQTSRERIRIVEKSFLQHLKAGDSQKPVFVLYPDYTLPNLDFITKEQEEKVFLKPVKFNANPYEANKRYPKVGGGKRPFSCNDVESLRRKGFNHIRDWDSLTFLLPLEYRQILAEMPEVVQQLREREDEILRREEKPLFCVSPPVKHKTRPASCDCTSLMGHGNTTNVSSSSSTATQPSSGYRGSSTMLTDSSAQNSPAPAPGFNPLFVYKYDSATSSEASLMNEKQRAGYAGAPPLPKRSISLAEQTKVAINGKIIDIAPPRPPLPKSILRKSIDKVRKTQPATNKRYSMFEMEDHMMDNVTCMNAQTDQKVLKRRSLQEPYYMPKTNSIVEMKKNNDLAAKRFSQQFLDATEKDMDDTEFFHDEGVGTESSLESGKSHDTRPMTPPLPKNSKIDMNPYVFPTSLTYPVISNSDLQQLEEFLKHSGITCNDMDDWDNTHMQKVKNQVSKFLTMKKSGDDSLDSSCSSGHSKKSVSFAEKSEKKVEGLKPGDDIKLSTPPNSPNVSAAQRHYQGKNLAEIPICEEGESSPEGYASPANTHRPGTAELAHKQGLVEALHRAVELVVQEGNGCPRSVVGELCPALYAVLSDGLRETIDTSFGPVNNTVWQIIEASARQGPITKSLNELVMRINSEDALSESVLKFNAFVMGLLNVQSLDAFVSYLLTRESILRRHYSATSTLRASNTHTLHNVLTPLTTVPFNLDILWQLRDMHRSFKRMEEMLSNQSSSNTMSSVGHLSKTQLNLLKLIHSIHLSATNASSDEQKETPQASVIMRNKMQQHCEENEAGKVKTTTWIEKARPRSCVNPSLNLLGAECPNNSGANSTYDPNTRRWSGVQLGSKLMQAFDRLALCDDSEEYTDSLEHEDKSKQHSDKEGSGEYKTEESNSSSSEWTDQNNGKFRRLQRRWEMLSGQEGSPHRQASDTQQSSGSPATTPGSQGSTPGSTSGKSRIPRPVTSPVRSSATTPPHTVSPVKRGIPIAVSGGKKILSPSGKGPLPPSGKGSQGATPKKTPTRVSRVESCYPGPSAPRPSSLPYRRAPLPSPSPCNTTRPTRRAVSSDQPRQNATKQPPQSNKMVRTLWHRLPSDSGHLAFNEGERLRLVLEVDQQWLLCCRGQQKGLVPRDAVIPVPQSALQRF